MLIHDNAGNPVEQSNPLPVKVIRYTCLSTDAKPIEGVKNGDELRVVDTKEVHIFHNGQWYLQ